MGGVWCAVAVWCCMRLCGLICHSCVCVCVCCATACVCMWWWWWCSVCVRTCWPFALAVWCCMWLCGLIVWPLALAIWCWMRLCGLICNLFARVMCHHVCVWVGGGGWV